MVARLRYLARSRDRIPETVQLIINKYSVDSASVCSCDAALAIYVRSMKHIMNLNIPGHTH